MVWSSSHHDGDTPQIDWWFVTSLIFIGRGMCHSLPSHGPSDIGPVFYGTVRGRRPNRPRGVRLRQEVRRSSYGTRWCHRVGAASRAYAQGLQEKSSRGRKILPRGDSRRGFGIRRRPPRRTRRSACWRRSLEFLLRRSPETRLAGTVVAKLLPPDVACVAVRRTQTYPLM